MTIKTSRKTIKMEFGNKDTTKNFIEINGVKLDLTGVGFFVVKITPVNNIEWSIGTSEKLNSDQEVITLGKTSI